MLDEKILERTQRLISVKFNAREERLPLEISRIESEAQSRGVLLSSHTPKQIFKLYKQEVEVRAVLVWESLVSIHKTLGSELTNTLSNDLKETFKSYVTEFTYELSKSMTSRLQKYQMQDKFSLNKVRNDVIQEHEIEIDIYVDSIQQQSQQKSEAATSQYNIYGNVGAIQTGSIASANVVQNLGSNDKAELLKTLEIVRDSINKIHEIDETQRIELTEIVNDSVTEINSKNPNSIKIRTLLTTVATTIQTVASARQVYQMLKAALLPLGITLP